MRRSTSALVVLASFCALTAKIAIAWNTYGTNDALTFEADIAKLKTAGPERLYREGVEPAPGHVQPFSHSPPVIHGLLLLQRLKNVSGLPVRFWLRVSCALADLASLLLLWKMGIRSATALLLVALSPVSLMISGFHVNTDPLMVCSVLAAVCLIQSGRFGWAGIILGLALSIKLTAIVFIPALAVAAGLKRTAVILGLASFCYFGLSLPYIWEFPKTIATSALTYSGLYQYWGVAGLSLLTGPASIHLWYRSGGKFVVLAMLLATAAGMRRTGRRGQILSNCGLLVTVFLVFTPGFGVQYLAYLVPWLAVARNQVVAGFYAVSGMFMFDFYTWGSRDFPWYLANFFTTRFMPVDIFILGLLTWFALMALTRAKLWADPRPVPPAILYGR